MPVAPSYPGVYIEEIPSGVRTIVGVATSITAFVGRAVSGPSNQPVLINSFADFDRQFGGLDGDYPLSYAVNDFYQNGGSQAIIVRVAASTSTAATLSVNGLNLIASSAGTWGNNLTATTDNIEHHRSACKEPWPDDRRSVQPYSYRDSGWPDDRDGTFSESDLQARRAGCIRRRTRDASRSATGGGVDAGSAEHEDGERSHFA